MPNLAVIGEGGSVFENLLKHRGTATGSALREPCKTAEPIEMMFAT